MGDTQAGGGPCAEAGEARTDMGDVQVDGIPCSVTGEMSGVSASRQNGGTGSEMGGRGRLE